ncbi:hypothetical protein Acr_02g0008640 [Actinidia rufa]|uniref:RRM domain-containing protein n=1 Tax=Actinidia rufa TaxID=165716 RepID=A0A7J0E822_9ERIC|nr:hypothetical protein Acr_02g0008640 [Actinidia rufa]
MDSEEEKYAAFEEMVKKTVYVDNLSPLVTEAVLKTAFNRFGNVEKVEFITNFTQLRTTAGEFTFVLLISEFCSADYLV